jgi:hypothetical protein
MLRSIRFRCLYSSTIKHIILWVPISRITSDNDRDFSVLYPNAERSRPNFVSNCVLTLFSIVIIIEHKTVFTVSNVVTSKIKMGA